MSDRAGKWYIERGGGDRVRVSLSEAVAAAVAERAAHRLGLAGGGGFDARARRVLAAR